MSLITCLATTSPATLESARSIRSAVGEAASEAGAPEPVVDAIVLCTGEAITNAALHAYEPARGPEGVVDVVLERSREELVVIVTDFGAGFADYVWTVFTDAARSLGGRAVGTEALGAILDDGARVHA